MRAVTFKPAMSDALDAMTAALSGYSDLLAMGATAEQLTATGDAFNGAVERAVDLIKSESVPSQK